MIQDFFARAIDTTLARRSILLGLAVLAATFRAGAQDTSAVKIGMLLPKQGVFAELGEAIANAAKLAIELSGSKVLGRNVELIWYDEPNPQGAQQNFMKLVEQDKVVAVIGGSNSASSLAIGAAAKRAKIPVVLGGGARELTGKACNRYTFRISTTVPAAARAIAPIALTLGRKVYFISASYAFGQDTYASMKPLILQGGGEEVGSDPIPLGTSDFSSFILKIRQAKPNVVVVGLAGGDLNNFLKQYGEYGMYKQAPVIVPIGSDYAVWALGAAAGNIIYGGSWSFDDKANTPEERAFAKSFRQKFGKPPSFDAWNMWMGTRLLLSAIERAKSTNGAAVVQALESVTLPSGSMHAYFRPWDHQMVSSLVIKKVHAPGQDAYDMMETLARMPATANEVDALFGGPAEIGCNMEAP